MPLTRTAGLITLLVVAAAPALSQERAWSLDYGSLGGASFEPFELKATPDGGVLALGRTDTGQTADDHTVAKFSQHGTLVWARGLSYTPGTLPADPIYNDSTALDVDPDGNIYVLSNQAQRGVVTCFTPAGDVAWETSLEIEGPNAIVEYTDIDASVPGDVVVAGVQISDSSLALPYDDILMLRSSDGSIRWRKTGSQGSHEGLLTRIQRGPGGMIVLAGQTDSFGFVLDPRVLVLDEQGDVRWEAEVVSTISLSPDDLEVTPAEEVIVLSSPGVGVARRVRLTRFDAAGTELFDVEWVPDSSPRARGGDLLLRPNGEIWVAGSVSREAALMRFDAAGQFLGSTNVTAATGIGGMLARLVPGEDGTAYAVGTIQSASAQDRTFLVAFDAAGNELYSQTLVDSVPSLIDERIGGIDAAVDARGNVFTLAQSTSQASSALQLVVSKTILGGSVGASYCGPAVANSTGAPALLRLLGQDEAASNNLSLAASQVPVDALVLFLTSRTQGLTVQAGGGEGTLCLGGTIGRFLSGDQLRRANDDGEAYLQLELRALPQPMSLAQARAGETWNFQAWFRDISAGATTSNLSDGVSVLFR